MKRKNIIFLKVLPILLLILTTWINTAKAQGVDAVFFLDNSSSIDDTEWTDMSNSTKNLIDQVLNCNPANRVSVVHYSHIADGFPNQRESRLYIESAFTPDAVSAKNFIRRGGVAASPMGGNTNTHQAAGVLKDILSNIINPKVLSPTKTLTQNSTNKLVVFLFTDGLSSDQIRKTIWEGTGGNFDNYNVLKTSKNATFVVLQAPPNTVAADYTAALKTSAAIASVGGSYTGALDANLGDPQGSGVKPRKIIGSPTFDISTLDISTIAQGICQSCAPVVEISAVTPPAQGVCLNGTAQPLVSTATGTGTLTYQWYSNTVNSTTGGTLIAGATSASYNPPTSAAGTRYYYVVVSDSYCEGKTTSPIVSVTVSSLSATLVPNINNTTAYSNSTGLYTIQCGSATANLSTLTASNTPIGSIITWHTDPIATAANRVTPVTAVSGTTKLYAAFYNSTGPCYSSTKMVTIVAPICAVDDDYTSTPIIAGVGGTLPSIFGNDTYSGTIISTMPANSVDFFYEMWTTANATVDGNGNLIIPATTPPGTYTYYYKICDKDPDVVSQTSCAIAEVKFTVVAAFGCNNNMYLSQSVPGSTTLYTIGTSTNPFTYPTVGTEAVSYNAMGLNPLDGRIYAIQAGTTNLLSINTDGSTTNLGSVTGLAAGTYFGGEIDDAGNYYVIANLTGGVSTMYRINLTTKVATAISLKYANNSVATLYLPDMSYSITTGLLYGVHGPTGQLVSISSTGIVTRIGTAPGVSQNFGAMYTSSTGEVFGVRNDGGFYQFNLTTGERVLISGASPSSGNDGAHCVTMPITFTADLQITKTDNTVTYTPGSTTTYTVTVTNSGPYGVLNAVVSDPVPAGIPAANVSYTAIASSGSTTTVSGTQTGAINDFVGLPVNGSVTYTIVVNIPMTFSGNLVNTATVNAPSNITDTNTANNTATDTDTFGVCYKPAITTGITLDTQHGISALGRAGTDNGNWPMVRKGAWTALEAKTKGFVINRLSTSQIANIPVANLIEGMMVYNTNLNCLQINTTGTAAGWTCLTNQVCPSN
ncbi:DUF6923 family protein [Chryseobacterium luquanense]|uniref:VWA domain-containing protein n=1 Tax=Chryseobacterium luquanense TaxID=2983766 RepID=A0ABT3Y4A3_9FLAO|nr:VWA domain-containing protein [Chryseobacterium luquanense]MCX8532968.1 VWA domain-containing protein [Chryseobacterium luquanense]